MSISMFPCCKFTEKNQIVTLQTKGSEVVWKSKDSKATLIGKFTLLFFSQIATGMLFRLEYRLLDVITGKSLRRGIQKGRRAFQAEALHKMLKNEQITNYKRAKKCAIAKAACLEVAISVVKCVFYPLALIALQAILILGFIAPYTGRYVYGVIEKKFAVGDFETTGCLGMFSLTNFSAICMQSGKVREKRNLLRYSVEDDLDKVQNIALIFNNYTENYAAYFTDSTKEELEDLRRYRRYSIELKKLYKEGIRFFQRKLGQFKDCIEAIDKNVERNQLERVKKLQDHLLTILIDKSVIIDNL